MNISEAKEEIKKSVEIYLDKNEYGEYTISVSKQRPIFMVGAPGIGKTAIMQQVASELDIALVSYSMSHHTRQSAIGLPVIEEREYEGKKYVVSEYTMSEIIASVYDVIKKTGKKEGILFLDEINCVSETLAPSMLLFLQYKIFGNQKVPEGWVIVTAGNPPQYNKSVKEFDLATQDRLKRLDISEDFTVWKKYAYQQGIHAAVISFLDINKRWFYSIQESVDGTKYVTARGWEDLSTAMILYEKKGFIIDRKLIDQYVTDTEIARKFGVYYDLYMKYRSDYQIQDILKGKMTDVIIERSQKAKIDERFAVVSLLLENLSEKFRETVERENCLQLTVKSLRIVKKLEKDTELSVYELIEKEIHKLQKDMDAKKEANSLLEREKEEYRASIKNLQMLQEQLGTVEEKDDFTIVKQSFDALVKQHNKQIKQVQKELESGFSYIEKVWGNKQELVLFLTELTAGTDSMLFINQWGSEKYFQYNRELLTYDQRQKLTLEIEEMLDEASEERKKK